MGLKHKFCWIAFTSRWLNKHSAIPTSKQDTWDCWGIFILISLVWALVFLSSGITRREPKMIKGFLSYCGTRTSYGAFRSSKNLAGILQYREKNQLCLVGTGIPGTTLAGFGLKPQVFLLNLLVAQLNSAYQAIFEVSWIKLHSMGTLMLSVYDTCVCHTWGYVICTNQLYKESRFEGHLTLAMSWLTCSRSLVSSINTWFGGSPPRKASCFS